MMLSSDLKFEFIENMLTSNRKCLLFFIDEMKSKQFGATENVFCTKGKRENVSPEG